MKEFKLSIIIVTYNSKKFIVRCLRSIKKYWPQFSTQILIIDNNSQDNTLKIVQQQKIKKLKIIKNEKNLGFSKAVNIGIKKSEGEYILLLNPDTVILNNTLNKLLDFTFQNKKIGIIGGKTLKTDKKEIHRTYFNKIDFLTALFEFTNLRKIFSNNNFHKNFYYIDKNEDRIRDVYGVSGGFMLIKKNVFKQIGYFDGNFFLYLEDVDFCSRAKEEGIKIVYYPEAVIKHEFGGASKNKFRINVKAWQNSRNYFFRKHFGFLIGNLLKLIFIVDNFSVNLKHCLFNEKS